MRRILAILLLLGLVGQLLQLALFDVRRSAVQREVKLKLKAGVPQGERTVFTFTQRQYDALRWLKPGKEFTTGEGFFDVIDRWEDASSNIHLSCMNDTQEAALFEDLALLVDQAMDRRGDGDKRTGVVYSTIKTWCSESVSFKITVPFLPVQCSTRSLTCVPLWTFEPPFPPPRVV
ncbi:MAG: hypothetical protein IPJ76_12100 [Flavobacteriales bacterium]|nr:MAG: hypothetical protein IPJ76_12100 [Flavobacteriales bacterium]